LEEWQSPDYFSPARVSNEALRVSDVPPDDATWQVLQRFALTFDGYRHWGSFERCEQVASHPDFGDLTSLRTTLFFEQRRWRHYDEHPDGDDLAAIRRVVAGIRTILREAESA
jgi:hypothetical protein